MKRQLKNLKTLLICLLCIELSLLRCVGALAGAMTVLEDRLNPDWSTVTDKEISDYYYTVEDEGQLPEVAEKVDGIVNTMPEELTVYEKVKYLHDYIVSHADYDFETLDEEDPDLSGYYASNIFLKGLGVCQAYTFALDILLETAGIKGAYNYGDNHIWNLVEMDGEWYNIDATWDDHYDGDDETHEGGTWNYEYFGVTTESLTETETRSHECTEADNITPNKIVAEGYENSYVYQEGLVSNALASAISAIQTRLDNGETSIAVTQPENWTEYFRIGSENQYEYYTELPNYTIIAALRDHEWIWNGQRVYPEIAYDSGTWTIFVRVVPKIASLTCSDSAAEGGGCIGTWNTSVIGASGDVTYHYELSKDGSVIATEDSASPVYTKALTEKGKYSLSVKTEDLNGVSSASVSVLDLNNITPHITGVTLSKTPLFADEELTVTAQVDNNYFNDFEGTFSIDGYGFEMDANFTGTTENLGYWLGTDVNRTHPVQVRIRSANGKTAYSEDRTVTFYGAPNQWFELDGNRYYLDSRSRRVTYLVTLTDGRYFFDENGIMQTGWQEINGSKYYFAENGAALNGWQVIDGYTYYFIDGNGAALTNGNWMIGDSFYRFDAEGHYMRPVEKITLSETEVSLLKGDKTVVTAEVSPADAYDRSVLWESSDPKIAEVSENGGIIAKSAGETTVICTAKDGSDVYAECRVTVISLVEDITLSETDLSLSRGEQVTLKADVYPEDASNMDVIWTSDHTDVATVSDTGEITAVGAGEATVTCTAKDESGITAQCYITVTNPVEGIILSETELSMLVGDVTLLMAEVLPEDASDQNTIWTSSNPEVATVSADGEITAIGAGETTVTCSADDESGETAECHVTVINRVEKIKLKKSASLKVGKTLMLKPTVTPADAKQKVKWSSEDPSIAKVNSKGKVTALKPGTVQITCKATDGSNKKAQCWITVEPIKVESFSVVKKGSSSKLNGGTLTLKKGKKVTVQVKKIKPSKATDKSVTFSSSKPKVATVSSSGVIKAKKSGTTTITVRSKDKNCKVTFTVKVEK